MESTEVTQHKVAGSHMNIHFICRGNVLRSLIAETYVKSLGLSSVSAISSGTNVNWSNLEEQSFFANSLALLDKHAIKAFTKERPDQLTQERIDGHHDIIVVMNDRVLAEAMKIVQLPENVLNWNITDIGEGDKTDLDSREMYEEEIYQEITQKVDELLSA